VTVAFLGIGSNLQDPRRQVEAALQELDQLPHTRLVRRSSLYRSAPLGHADQPDFINAVAQVETGLSAERLLAELQGVEERHGRVRTFANAPRTLDLDVLVFGDLEMESEKLTVPHPRMHERAFVLRPLVEIAADASIPGKGAASALLEKCADQALERIA
jgi:2-amino-4-hydroxy-6-hydroxymethyldihydropteridine diphosphokinase